MSRQGDFMVYCTELYKSAKNMTGKQVSNLFTSYQVWDYISIPALRHCIPQAQIIS